MSLAFVDMEEVLNAEQVFEPERAIQVPDMLSGLSLLKTDDQ
jgi:hypothetical protein